MPSDGSSGAETARRAAGGFATSPSRRDYSHVGGCRYRAPTRRKTTSTTIPRVVLADDDVLLREGLASLLERSGFEVVGRAGDAAELLSLTRTLLPDLVLIDIRMPPTHTTEGLDAAKVIRDELPDLGILVLSAYIDVEHATNLLGAGERMGYLLKSRVTDVDEFMETLERIMKGGSAIDPAVVQELVATRRVDDPLGALTERERDVLALMAEGRSNVGIANRLWVTEGTVEKHVGSILTKLDLYSEEDDHRRVLAVLTYLDSQIAGRAAILAAAPLGEELLDGPRGEPRFGQKPDRGARGDEVGEVLGGVGRDQDDLRPGRVRLPELPRDRDRSPTPAGCRRARRPAAFLALAPGHPRSSPRTPTTVSPPRLSTVDAVSRNPGLSSTTMHRTLIA